MKRAVEILSSDDVRALLQHCELGPTGIRNKALIALMFRGGLRVSEALALMPKDYEAETGTVRILHGKGDKPGVVAIDETAGSLIDAWLESRSELGLGDDSPLFCTRKGRGMARRDVQEMMTRVGWKAGIRKRVHPHGLRHSFAAGLAAEGVPINVISGALRHKSVATTAIYIGHIQPQEVIDCLRSRSWD